MRSLSISSAIAACLVSPYSLALDAHVHGAAVLEVAKEGGEIEAVLRSPMANIVGFEYEARSAEDKATQANALEILKNANNILKLSASA
ncbi:ZrgA family zinc uptake protein, partial [Neptuniibacter pectenicola]